MKDKIFLQGLAVRCKIGIFEWERKVRQKIVIDLEMPADVRKASRKDQIQDALDYKAIAKHIITFVSQSEYFLIETLAEKLAARLLEKFELPEILLRVSKPGAIRGSQNVGIEIKRKRK